MENGFKNANEDLKGPEYWKGLADKVEVMMQQHGGKPRHLTWTVNMLRKGNDIEVIKSDYFQQRDKLELFYKDIRDLLDEEFK